MEVFGIFGIILFFVLLFLVIKRIAEHIQDETRSEYDESYLKYLAGMIFKIILFCSFWFVVILIVLSLSGDLEEAFPKIYNSNWKEFLIRLFGIFCIIYSSYILFVEYSEDERATTGLKLLVSSLLGFYLILFY